MLDGLIVLGLVFVWWELDILNKKISVIASVAEDVRHKLSRPQP